MVDTMEIRMTRVENDIETLRTTQGALLDRYDQFYKVQRETLEIATENRSRLKQIEDRLNRVEDRQQRMEDRLTQIEEVQKRMEDRQDNLERIALANSAAILENRQILLTIADHLDLTIPKPDSAE